MPITLTVNGEAHGGWKTARVTRSLDHAAGDFSLTISERWPGQITPNQHQPAATSPASSQEQTPARTTAEAWSARQSWGCHGHAPAMDDAARLRTIVREYPTLG